MKEAEGRARLAVLELLGIDEVRGGRGDEAPKGCCRARGAGWAETVVTLEVIDEASLPEEPGRISSSSKDWRGGGGGGGSEGAGDLETRSGETGERSILDHGEGARGP